MTQQELHNQLLSLAEECRDSHPEIASVLYGTLGSLAAGGCWPYLLMQTVSEHAKRFVQFCTGDGESIS
jgi:hypothetical protein